MSASVARLAALLLVCVLASAAAAAPLSFYLEGGAKGDPTMVAFGKDDQHRVAVLVRGLDDALWWRKGNGQGHWEPWERIGGAMKDSPSCVTRDASTVDCFVRGLDDALWHASYAVATNKWSGWESRGGKLTAAPSAAIYNSPSAGKGLFAVVRGAGGDYHSIYWANGAWGAWQASNKAGKSAPACAGVAGGLWCGYIHTGSDEIMLMTEAASTTPQTGSTGGASKRKPSLIGSPFGGTIAHLFATGADNLLWLRTWRQDKGWEGWKSLGVPLVSAPGCTWEPNASVWCAAIEANGTVAVHRFTPGTW